MEQLMVLSIPRNDPGVCPDGSRSALLAAKARAATAPGPRPPGPGEVPGVWASLPPGPHFHVLIP